MATNGPIPILLLPDGVLTGRSNVVSVTSETGVHPAPAVADDDNLGDLVPQASSPGLSADYAYDVSLLRAGGVYSLAEWAWKNQTDTSSQYRGVDEVRYFDDPHDPYTPVGLTSATHPATSMTSVMSAVHAKRIGKILIYMAGPSIQTVYCRYRSIGAADPNAWTLTTFNLTVEGGGAVKAAQTTGIEALEMPDGTLRLLVVSGTSGTADNDVHVFSSSDGLTWALCARAVLSKAYGKQIDCRKFRAAQSGEWTRFVVIDNNGPTMRTFVSSDRCATWTWLQDSNKTGADMPESNGNAVDPYGHLDIEGLGDATGTFICAFRDGTATNKVLRYIVAGRDADWSENVSLMNTVLDIYATALVQDGTRFYAIVTTGSTVGNIQVELSFVELDRALEEGVYAWASLSCPWGTYSRYMPAYTTAVRGDPGIAFLFGLVDLDTGPGNAVGSSSCLLYLRRWTVRSLWTNEREKPPSGGFTNDFMTLRWDSLTGLPNRAATFTTPVAHWSGVNGSATWLADRLRIDSTNTSNGKYYFAYNEGAAPAKPWASTLPYIGWIVGVLTTTLNAFANDRTAVRVRALANSSGATFDLSFRHGVSGLVVYDQNASQALTTFTLNLADKFYRVRVGFGLAATTVVEVAVCAIGDEATTTGWSTATVTPTSAVGATFQGYEWGCMSGTANLSSHWRRIEHDQNSNCHQYGFTNPSYLRGLPCAAQPVFLQSDLYLGWSGGAGFEGDAWTLDPRHTNEVENLFLPSPDAAWVGTSLTTQQIVFVASASDTTKLLDHAGIAVFGTSTHRMTVEYAQTNSWGSPGYSAAVTNDLTPALLVSAVTNGCVTVSGATLDDGEYVGKYLRTALSGSNVISFEIERQVGQKLYLGAVGSSLVTMAFSAGASAWIHDDKFVVEHSSVQRYPYMRLTFPAPSGTTTATLDVRAGTLVAGVTHGFSTAINWAHSQSEVPNVELNEGGQGLRWGFELGRSRRTFEGTIRGDVARSRRMLANQLRTLAGFSAKPLVLATDKENLQRSAMLARFTGTIERDEVGWKQAEDGSWFPVGDLTVTFEEEV